MKLIVQILFGSHLYGTATPQSDRDVMGAYIPDARDILLQRIAPVVSQSRPKSHGEKNTAEDTDREFYSLHRYLELLAEGQTVALDMLFAPDWAMAVPPDPVWREVQQLGPRLLTRGATAFVRYCRQQANKYGIKGSRVAAARMALGVLQQAEAAHGASERLGAVHDALLQLAATNEFLTLGEDIEPNGNRIAYFQICGKKTLLTASIKTARDIAQRLVGAYGQRALAAERNEGVDWKALSHAVRVGHEALELFTTGRITFPRPEAARLLAIKQGTLPYMQVADEIAHLLAEVERAAETSALPDKADSHIIDDFVAEIYRRQIAGA